jgi:hypothetical protein
MKHPEMSMALSRARFKEFLFNAFPLIRANPQFIREIRVKAVVLSRPSVPARGR